MGLMAEGSNQDADASVTARTGGGYRHRMDNVEAITVSDFYNPWNFYAVFMKEDSFVVKWCGTKLDCCKILLNLHYN